MKKLTPLLAVMAVITLITAAFKPADNAPKLYSELEAYFKSIDPKEFTKDHLESLENLKYNITISNTISEDLDIIFYCSENTFRSQASQVFAQTLFYSKKHKKAKAYSAGLTSGTINPKLLSYLTKIGYKINPIQKDGKSAYEVRFSDQAEPVILFSKTVTDKSLPTKEISSIIVCDINKETDCASLTTVSKPLNLAFPQVLTTDADSKADVVLKSIASEMVYVTNK